MGEEMKQVPLEFICRHERTAEVCRAAIEEEGWQLEHVPEEVKNARTILPLSLHQFIMREKNNFMFIRILFFIYLLSVKPLNLKI